MAERQDRIDSPDPARRGFLSRLGQVAVGTAVALAVPAFTLPDALAATLPNRGRRSLSFRSLHTGERLKAIYWVDGRYQANALIDINHILRDWRSGEVRPMDPALLDLLFALRRKLRTEETFHIISAYRGPKTNAGLAARSDGVARGSMHMEGKAIDIALPDRRLHQIQHAALDLQQGGVGLYPKSGFVHVDTGRVRRWAGV
jgi:uncharacterized protein YcbK (DUF882 family)